MKLGILTALFQDQSLEKALDIITNLGVEANEKHNEDKELR